MTRWFMHGCSVAEPNDWRNPPKVSYCHEMTTTAETPAAAAGPGPGATAEDHAAYARRWWTLAVLCLSLLIVFVGNSSLNVAIPTLSRDLHATTSQLQWVVAAYSLVFAGLLFSTGALGDRFGRKGALQLGLVGFLVGRVLASESTEMWQLIACRALMGASAALIMPSTLSILVNVFPPARARQGHRDLGRDHRCRRRDRPGGERLPARPLLVRLGVPRERPDHRARARRRLVPRPEVA